MKPLPLKWIPFQVPLIKSSNFSNNYMIVYISSGCFSYFIFYMLWGDYLKALSFIEKVAQGLILKNFRKCFLKTLLNSCFSNKHSKNFYVVSYWKMESERNVCLCWCIVMSCISHASGKVLPRVWKLYQQIFYESCFQTHQDGWNYQKTTSHFKYSWR